MDCFENIRIETIDKSELDQVAQLLTNAFETNPAYSLIFKDNNRIREGLFWLFRASLFLSNHRQPLTNVIKEKDSGKIIGAFSIVPPGGINVRLMDYFRIGLPSFLQTFGFSTLRTMLEMNAYNKEILNQSMQTKEYYYLSMVAICEEYRGKGIGSYVIKNCLDQLSTLQREYDCVGLTTQLPENVVFYSKLGFEIMDETPVSFKGNSYFNCNMKFNL